MLREFTSPFDATSVRLLRDAGATIVGKANCDEFGMGSLNIYTIHGPVINPSRPQKSSQIPLQESERRSAGGSSGGSAAAVAAGMCDAAIATDTGGSIRLPASYCGVVGLKPSYGMISRWGVISYADSLDCVGVIGKDIQSTEKVYNALSSFDPNDPTAAQPETREAADKACNEHMAEWASSDTLTGLRIGIPQEYFPASLNPSILSPFRRILRSLKTRGATLVPVSLKNTSYALSTYYAIASAEASSNLARYDGVQYGLHVDPPPGSPTHTPALTYAHSRTAGFGSEVKKRILLGTYALTADAFDNYFLQAQRLRKAIRQDFNRVFVVPDALSSAPSPPPKDVGVHVLLHPSAIRTAPPLPLAGATKDDGESLDAYMQDVLTVPASLAGLPALSVPISSTSTEGDGWPIGLSVVGQWGCEKMVLEVGRSVEETR